MNDKKQENSQKDIQKRKWNPSQEQQQRCYSKVTKNRKKEKEKRRSIYYLQQYGHTYE